MKNTLSHRLSVIFMVLLFFFPFPISAGEEIIELKNLDVNKNETLKELRNDIRKSIYVIKGRRPPEELPQLRFYRYRVKDKESFWSILSRLSLDIDTLMTVNDLSSPGEVKPGKSLYVPNMRGIIISGNRKKEMARILVNERINLQYVYRANGTNTLEREFLFVPCGKISLMERSLFLGTGFMFPLEKGRRTSGFGTRRNPFDEKRNEFHRGIDLACPVNSPVYAARDGRVVFTGYEGGYGKMVVIKHEHGYSSCYGHLSSIKARVGQEVRCGDLIATSGNTGRSTGPHLHFEVRRGKRAVNPGILLKK